MHRALANENVGYTICKKTKQKKILSVLLVCLLILSFTACGGGGGGGSADDNADPNAPDRDNTPKVLVTEAPGEKTFSAGDATVDYSNAAQGYIMAQYKGSNKKVKMQIFIGDVTYSYDLSANGKWEAFPLSMGSGDYAVGVFENISGEQYSQLLKDSFSVELESEFGPFLHPNQFVNFTKDSLAVAKSEEVSKGAKTDLGAVERILEFVTENIEYDYDKAENVQPGYLPDIDETLRTGKGICFDYAAVMSTMLRVQRIPCKLVIGYAGDAYHAWISIYSEETGWLENVVEFAGDEWKFVDPTFISAGDNSDPNVVGSGANHKPSFFY